MNKCQKLRMQNLRVGTIVVFLPFTLSICQGETILLRFFMKAKTAFLQSRRSHLAHMHIKAVCKKGC